MINENSILTLTHKAVDFVEISETEHDLPILTLMPWTILQEERQDTQSLDQFNTYAADTAEILMLTGESS